MMRLDMRSLMLGAMGLALVAGSAVAQVTVTSSLRSVYAQAIGYDWDFYGGDSALESSSTTTGGFNATASVDVQEWYGGQVGAADAAIVSDISADGIVASFDLVAECIDVGVYQGDAQGEGRLDIDFTVASPVRAVISFEAFCYDDYSWTFASLNRVGVGSVLSLYVFGNDDAGIGTTTWLQTGSYSLDVEATTWAFGTYGTSDDATNITNISVLFFDAADYNTDGQVTPADRSAFLAAYSAGSLAADFNGDGVITNADRQGFLAAYRAARQ